MKQEFELLIEAIKRLLLTEGQVALGDLGLLQSFDADASITLAPGKVITFTEGVHANREALSHFLQEQHQWPAGVTDVLVSDFVNYIRYELLLKHKCALTGIGVLFLQPNYSIRFEQVPAMLANDFAFGLPQLIVMPPSLVSMVPQVVANPVFVPAEKGELDADESNEGIESASNEIQLEPIYPIKGVEPETIASQLSSVAPSFGSGTGEFKPESNDPEAIRKAINNMLGLEIPDLPKTEGTLDTSLESDSQDGDSSASPVIDQDIQAVIQVDKPLTTSLFGPDENNQDVLAHLEAALSVIESATHHDETAEVVKEAFVPETATHVENQETETTFSYNLLEGPEAATGELLLIPDLAIDESKEEESAKSVEMPELESSSELEDNEPSFEPSLFEDEVIAAQNTEIETAEADVVEERSQEPELDLLLSQVTKQVGSVTVAEEFLPASVESNSEIEDSQKGHDEVVVEEEVVAALPPQGTIESAKQTGSPILAWVLTGVLTLAVLAGGYWWTQQPITNTKVEPKAEIAEGKQTEAEQPLAPESKQGSSPKATETQPAPVQAPEAKPEGRKTAPVVSLSESSYPLELDQRPAGKTFLVVGSFKDKGNAIKLVKQLRTKGIEAVAIPGKRLTQVSAGVYDSKAGASAALDNIQAKTGLTPIITR